MILQFRTETNKSGHCKYIALDTGAECYATSPRSWISKDIPVLKKKDYDSILEKVQIYEWKRLDNM